MEAKSHSHRNNSIGEEPPSCQSIETHSKNIHLNDSNWYKVSTTETLHSLNSDKNVGLSEEDVSFRRSKYGKNN